MEKKLYRDERRKVIGGVCAGLADYFDIDISIIRALFLLTFIFMGTGFMVYIVLWIVLPKKDFGNPPQPGDPFINPPKKGVSNAGLVFGVILIFIGGAFLLHEVHLFRFWHMGKLWPVILVVAGLAIMVSGEKKKPWEKDKWQATDTNDKEEIKDDTLHKDDDFKQEDKPTDTPPPTV
jgi:phage shock protein PspC (stress-responsive transcriptional regulator)